MFSPDGNLISASAAPHCGGQKNKRGDSKVKSDDSPEIPDRGGGGDIGHPWPPFGVYKKVLGRRRRKRRRRRRRKRSTSIMTRTTKLEGSPTL